MAAAGHAVVVIGVDVDAALGVDRVVPLVAAAALGHLDVADGGVDGQQQGVDTAALVGVGIGVGVDAALPVLRAVPLVVVAGRHGVGDVVDVVDRQQQCVADGTAGLGGTLADVLTRGVVGLVGQIPGVRAAALRLHVAVLAVVHRQVQRHDAVAAQVVGQRVFRRVGAGGVGHAVPHVGVAHRVGGVAGVEVVLVVGLDNGVAHGGQRQGVLGAQDVAQGVGPVDEVVAGGRRGDVFARQEVLDGGGTGDGALHGVNHDGDRVDVGVEGGRVVGVHRDMQRVDHDEAVAHHAVDPAREVVARVGFVGQRGYAVVVHVEGQRAVALHRLQRVLQVGVGGTDSAHALAVGVDLDGDGEEVLAEPGVDNGVVVDREGQRAGLREVAFRRVDNDGAVGSGHVGRAVAVVPAGDVVVGVGDGGEADLKARLDAVGAVGVVDHAVGRGGDAGHVDTARGGDHRGRADERSVDADVVARVVFHHLALAADDLVDGRGFVPRVREVTVVGGLHDLVAHHRVARVAVVVHATLALRAQRELRVFRQGGGDRDVAVGDGNGGNQAVGGQRVARPGFQIMVFIRHSHDADLAVALHIVGVDVGTGHDARGQLGSVFNDELVDVQVFGRGARDNDAVGHDVVDRAVGAAVGDVDAARAGGDAVGLVHTVGDVEGHLGDDVVLFRLDGEAGAVLQRQAEVVGALRHDGDARAVQCGGADAVEGLALGLDDEFQVAHGLVIVQREHRVVLEDGFVGAVARQGDYTRVGGVAVGPGHEVAGRDGRGADGVVHEVLGRAVAARHGAHALAAVGNGDGQHVGVGVEHGVDHAVAQDLDLQGVGGAQHAVGGVDPLHEVVARVGRGHEGHGVEIVHRVAAGHAAHQGVGGLAGDDVAVIVEVGREEAVARQGHPVGVRGDAVAPLHEVVAVVRRGHDVVAHEVLGQRIARDGAHHRVGRDDHQVVDVGVEGG